MVDSGFGVRAAKSSEMDGVAELLSLAFTDDPVSRWIFPGEKRRRQVHPEFFGAFAGFAFDHGEVCVTSDFSAAVLWIPGGGRDLLDRFAALTGDERKRFDALAEVREANEPSSPHLQAQWLGVLPRRRGAGIGRALLRQRLETLKVPVYVEASSVAGAALCRGLGFVEAGVAFGAEGGPTVVPMLRQVGGS
jgi:GNAT superfamily N-acetyltransferase